MKKMSTELGLSSNYVTAFPLELVLVEDDSFRTDHCKELHPKAKWSYEAER